MAMKKLHVGVVLGTAAMMLALWAMRPRAELGELPKHPKAPRSTPEATQEVPPVDLANRPLQVGLEARASEPFRPLKADPEAMLAKRMARMQSALGARGPGEYLRGIPPGMGDMGREAALRKTADHLSIEAGSSSAFLAAARQSVQDLEQARALRSQEVRALGVISPGVGDELRLSSERYAAAREGALSRVEPYLGQSPAAQDFRHEFDAWAALVVSKGKPLHQ